jgi:hypothetical protein
MDAFMFFIQSIYIFIYKFCYDLFEISRGTYGFLISVVNFYYIINKLIILVSVSH